MIEMVTDKDIESLDLEQMIDWVEYQIDELEYDRENMDKYDSFNSNKNDNHTALKNILNSLHELKGWKDYKSLIESISPIK